MKMPQFFLIVIGLVAVTTATDYSVLLKPGWNEWSGWSTCSLPCGGGYQTRSRICPSRVRYGLYGLDGRCRGLDKESRPCNFQPCIVPVNGGWSAWSDYVSCSTTCEAGTQSRTRTCSNPAPANGGVDCVGSGSESQTCNADVRCPVNGGWSEWSVYGTCSTTCEAGTQSRSRTCSNPAPANGGADCVGSGSESQTCNVDVRCPVNGGWSDWSGYGTCSTTCEAGTQSRSRACTNPAPANGGADCVGSGSESQTCNADVRCPVDGSWGPWGAWSEWSNWSVQPTPERTHTRTRACDSPAPAFGGKPCEGPSSEDETQKCRKYGYKCSPYY